MKPLSTRIAEATQAGLDQTKVRIDSLPSNEAVTMLRDYLIEIRDVCQQAGLTFEGQSFKVTSLAQDALARLRHLESK